MYFREPGSPTHGIFMKTFYAQHTFTPNKNIQKKFGAGFCAEKCFPACGAWHTLTVMTARPSVTVETTVAVPAATAWELWTRPKHIMQWNNASDDWHTPHAESDLREGGKFLSRMEARDGSMGFDFTGTFTRVAPNAVLAYTMDDGRTVTVTFAERDGATHITETFDAESENPVEMQRQGWQAILDNFKSYAEKTV